MIRLAPIGAADTDRVAAFLQEQMERQWSLDLWRQAISPSTSWPSS